ncbi:MAG: AI-2E family transporter [Patescibacteria group bacterium]
MEIKGSTFQLASGSIVRVILFLVLFWLIFYLRDLVLIILTAVVIASSIEPFIQWFHKIKVSRVLSTLFIYLAFGVFLMGTIYFLVPPLLNEAIGIIERLPPDLRNIDFSNLTKGTEFLTGNESLQFAKGLSISDTFSNTKEIINSISGNFFKTTGVLFGGLLSLALITVLSFYFAVQETGIDDFLRVITPTRHQDYVVGLWKRAQVKIGLWMQGQMILGVIVGILVYLGLTILGVPYAFFLAILAMVFELVPVFGPIIAAVPATIMGFVDGGASTGFFTIGLFLIIQQFENHLIYPLVVRKVVGIPPILVIIALIVGAKLAGFLGIILSVPVSAALKEFIDDVQRKKEIEKRNMVTNNV